MLLIAVMSAVNVEIFKLLFPASVEQITFKAAEHRQAAFVSGKATASDIAAGAGSGTRGGDRVRRARGEIPGVPHR